MLTSLVTVAMELSIVACIVQNVCCDQLCYVWHSPGVYRYFNEFLMAHSRDTAEQVRSEYVDTMSKVYFSYFKDYYSKLLKLEV